jgi:hypothetical protein
LCFHSSRFSGGEGGRGRRKWRGSSTSDLVKISLFKKIDVGVAIPVYIQTLFQLSEGGSLVFLHDALARTCRRGYLASHEKNEKNEKNEKKKKMRKMKRRSDALSKMKKYPIRLLSLCPTFSA